VDETVRAAGGGCQGADALAGVVPLLQVRRQLVALGTGVPAQHGPDGTEHLTGPGTGFVLYGDGVPTTYVSGDNASLDVVRAVADRFAPLDVAVLFMGAARTPLVGDVDLTLGSDAAAEAAKILRAARIVPLHFEGWAHFTQGRDTIRPAFDKAGLTGSLHLLDPGQDVTL
jgi:L-ascorbate metabolism protein UlaG (beta-lactamase superfamily)